MKNTRPRYSSLGQFLKEKRAMVGKSQAELAEMLGGMHPQFVSNWERGLCAPPSNSFNTVIKILKIDRSELVNVMMEDSRAEIELQVLGKKRVSGR